MSQAEELLNSLSTDEIVSYSVSSSEEPHIIIGKDRYITVPTSLQRIAVEHDHDIETVTFECPRYWDDHDLSKMAIYINYILSNGYADSYPVSTITIRDDIMLFTWTISRNVTQVSGDIKFLVCAKKTDADGNEVNHWNSELCEDMYVSQGMETVPQIASDYPDLITELLLRMSTVEQINVQADEMQTILDEAHEVAAVAETVKEEAIDASNILKNSFANAVKGTANGSVVRMDDISPVEHTVNTRVTGKNLFDISQIESHASITNNGNSITMAANAFHCGTGKTLSQLCPGLREGDVVTLSFISNATKTDYIFLYGIRKQWRSGETITITNDMLNSTISLYGYHETDPLYGQEHVISNIQVELGTEVSEYETYISSSNMTLMTCSKNFWHSKDIAYPRTISGVTIDYDPDTQVYTFNGTSTSPGDIYVQPNGEHIMRINAGETWSLKVDIIGGTIDGLNTCSGKISPLVNTQTYTNTIHANTESLQSTKTYTEPADITKMYFYVYSSGIAFKYFKCRVQFEPNSSATDFVKSTGIIKYTPSVDGTVESVKSIYPCMVLKTNRADSTINAEYNRDSNAIALETVDAVDVETSFGPGKVYSADAVNAALLEMASLIESLQ